MEVIKVLCDAGADVNNVRSKEYSILSQYASKYIPFDESVVKILIRQGVLISDFNMNEILLNLQRKKFLEAKDQ